MPFRPDKTTAEREPRRRKFRDERLSMCRLFSHADARRQIKIWRVDLNTVRPHTSLRYTSPSLTSGAAGLRQLKAASAPRFPRPPKKALREADAVQNSYPHGMTQGARQLSEKNGLPTRAIPAHSCNPTLLLRASSTERWNALATSVP